MSPVPEPSSKESNSILSFDFEGGLPPISPPPKNGPQRKELEKWHAGNFHLLQPTCTLWPPGRGPSQALLFGLSFGNGETPPMKAQPRDEHPDPLGVLEEGDQPGQGGGAGSIQDSIGLGSTSGTQTGGSWTVPGTRGRVESGCREKQPPGFHSPAVVARGGQWQNLLSCRHCC